MYSTPCGCLFCPQALTGGAKPLELGVESALLVGKLPLDVELELSQPPIELSGEGLGLSRVVEHRGQHDLESVCETLRSRREPLRA